MSLLSLSQVLASQAPADGKDKLLYSGLNEYQRDYYFRVFDYTMDNIKAGKSYHWDARVAKGDIAVGEKYLSKSQSICRNFTEIFEVGKQAEKNEGVACKRNGGNGWCKLKYQDARTCALENPQNTTDKMLNDTDSVLDKGEEFLRNTKDWWNR